MTPDGHLANPINGIILKRNVMTQKVHFILKSQGIDFGDDCRKWTRGKLIHIISTVMGIDSPYDPDETYILTSDNLIKILAIQMRFRYELYNPLFYAYKWFKCT